MLFETIEPLATTSDSVPAQENDDAFKKIPIRDLSAGCHRLV